MEEICFFGAFSLLLGGFWGSMRDAKRQRSPMSSKLLWTIVLLGIVETIILTLVALWFFRSYS